MREVHPNSEELKKAIREGKAEEVAAVIRRDPRVLADFDVKGGSRDYCPLTYALSSGTTKTLKMVLAALTDPENSALIKAELARQGRSHEVLNGNLLYPYSAWNADAGIVYLPHVWVHQPEQLNLLHEAGYDLTISGPGIASILNMHASRLNTELHKADSDWKSPCDMIRRLRELGVDLNHPWVYVRKHANSLPQFTQMAYQNSCKDAPFYQNFHANAYESLAEDGVDLRGLLQSGSPGRYHADQQKALRALGRFHLALFPAVFDSKEKREASLRPICATGALPELLQRLVKERRADPFDAVLGSLDDYWRIEYRHAISTAQATFARNLPTGESALNRWARGGAG